MGIEPTSKAWKALVLPLNYARVSSRTTGASFVLERREGCARMTFSRESRFPVKAPSLEKSLSAARQYIFY